MEVLSSVVETLSYAIWSFGIPVGGETIPLVVIALLGTGAFLTIQLGFVQVRKLGHGFAVASGKYDDPDDPGDVSHFQALTTALSATVGIGNIAGVGIAIHWGGPGALFWMWMTALVGMATKYAEVTLAQRYREVGEDKDARAWEGSVSGGPMYYIEHGLGPAWKPLAMFFALMLGLTAFLTGNGVQANTVADTMHTEFGIAPWITGLVTAATLAAVVIGGIQRIGKVTGILAPLMAVIYVSGALVILALNVDKLGPAVALIVREAFNPTAGVAGTGVGAILVTMMWGVKRGLFSNEAGQGSAPIAHAAAKTDEPVSEGVVALVEPFIDTILICTMTALVIIVTGVWTSTVPTKIDLDGGDLSYVQIDESGSHVAADPPAEILVEDGKQVVEQGGGQVAWHEVAVGRLFVDENHDRPFSGVIHPEQGTASGTDGATYEELYGPAVESAAPLTMEGFRRGLSRFGDWGHYIVLLSVLLFGVSTAIAWSYYGDRCANYLIGPSAVLPYKLVFVGMHFLGAVFPLSLVWAIGDVLLGIVILPNIVGLIVLSPKVVELTRSYFERKPWLKAAEARRRRAERDRAQ